MTLKNQILYFLAQKTLARNRRFKNLHKGQSCYIFGNGVSLKSMDFEKFNDKIAIGCNSLFLHKDFEKLDCRYYQLPPPFLFYPYRSYYGRLQRNYMGGMYRKKIKQHKKTIFFTSLSNILNMRGNNIFYTHHFGNVNWDLDQCEMDGVFSWMEGSIFSMLGTAIYMGFESATLVGCDYTFSPRHNLHFFEKGMGFAKEVEDVFCGSLFEVCQKQMDLRTIVPAGTKSDILKYVTYEDYAGSPSHYRENTDIVSTIHLEYLHKQSPNYVVY